MAGIQRGSEQLTVVDHAAIVKSQDLARAYARDRAAEMVGMKWVNGDLVPNPNAQWVISDTTRDEIRKLVEDAFADETPLGTLVDQIKMSGAFSEERAKLIATTEISNAQSKANFNVWQQTGVVESVRWMVSSLGCCDECSDNEDAGAIPFGETFPSGDDAPPAHPNCRCYLLAVKIKGLS